MMTGKQERDAMQGTVVEKAREHHHVSTRMKPAPITVLTVTIPGREHLLAEQVATIFAQTVPVERQLICAHLPTTSEEPQVHYSAAKNSMLPAVSTPWVAVLNDDDLWLPNHVETVLPHLKNADVIYTWDAGRSRPRMDCNDRSTQEIADQLGRANFIDGNCLIRRKLLEKVGGFPTDWVGEKLGQGGHYALTKACFEDWALWQRICRAGGRFRCVPVETWRYRMGTPGGNLSG
jgi:hypothetical protein